MYLLIFKFSARVKIATASSRRGKKDLFAIRLMLSRGCISAGWLLTDGENEIGTINPGAPVMLAVLIFRQ